MISLNQYSERFEGEEISLKKFRWLKHIQVN